LGEKCVTLEAEGARQRSRPRKTWKDCGQGHELLAHKTGKCLEGTGVTVRVIVTVMPRAEYKLYISAADSPRFTRIKGR